MKVTLIFVTAMTLGVVSIFAQTDSANSKAIAKAATLSEKETIELGIEKFKMGQRKEAYELLSPRANSKYFNAEAEYFMGDFYREGVGWGLLRYDVNIAMKWFKKAAGHGNADAMAVIGVIYDGGGGDIKKDEKEALKWYKKAAEKGSGIGQDIYGTKYSTGRVVPQDFAEALKWHRMSAGQGCSLGILSLAATYEEGQGLPKDTAEAIRLYFSLANKKAGDDTYGPARATYILHNLGYSAITGKLLTAAEEIAIGMDDCIRTQYDDGFKLISKNSNSASMTDTAFGWLAYMYDHGYGVTENATEAFRYFNKAAGTGNAVAENNLANEYHTGRGTAKNFSEALKWYQKAALQENWDAQVNLGLMYTYGEGVKKDDAVATEWYRKAALQDWGWGQYYLGLAYRNGTGVAVDNAKSQLLLGYAVGHGVAPAEALYVKKEAGLSNSNSYNSNGNGGYQQTNSKTTCSCCRGAGTTMVYSSQSYQKYDQFGSEKGIPSHYINVSCSCCHGTGMR